MSINLDTYKKDKKLNLVRILDDLGDGTGVFNATGNYSNNITKFYIQDFNNDILIKRLIVFISDAGSFDAGSYGNGITVSNGISIKKLDVNNNVLVDFTKQKKIKTNADLSYLSYGIQNTSFGSGLNYITAEIYFDDGINLKRGEQFAVFFNDNFTNLNEHLFTIKGYII